LHWKGYVIWLSDFIVSFSNSSVTGIVRLPDLVGKDSLGRYDEPARETTGHWRVKKYHTVGTVPKPNRKIVERGKINTPNTLIHDHSLPWLGTGTLLKKWRG
jgi:hypothetical protein